MLQLMSPLYYSGDCRRTLVYLLEDTMDVDVACQGIEFLVLLFLGVSRTYSTLVQLAEDILLSDIAILLVQNMVVPAAAESKAGENK
jgi:hypothetical protein